ncbi:MAG: threonine/serine exporter family protein [Microlunatus sp.]|nr:threonine/serine exporter family protein [Microlunatus sp.]
MALLLYRLTRPPPAGESPLATAASGSVDVADLPATPPTEDDVLLLMSTAGEALIDAGFNVNDVQSDLRHIAVKNNMPEVEIIALPTLLIVSLVSGRGLRTGAVAAGRTPLQLHQIEDIDDVVTQARRGLDPREAVRQIHAIRAKPSPFTPPVQLSGGVLAAMGLAVLLGSSWRGVLISGLLGVVTAALLLLAQKVPSRYQPLVAVTASGAVSLIVLVLARLGIDSDVVPTVIAPLVTLLPGALLTMAVIELATGQMISGAGRAAAGLTQLLLLALGLVGPALLIGVPTLELHQQPTLGVVGPWLAVGVFGVGIGLNRSVRPRSLGWLLIVLYVAYGGQVLGGLVVGGILSAFVGALLMTPVADLVARQRTGPPAIVSFTPAFWLLVPGALGLMGLATMLSGEGGAQQTLLTTVSTMVTIALGVLMGRAVSIRLGLRKDRPE